MPGPSPRSAQVVDQEDDLRSVVEEARRADRIALDIEASMHAYASRACTVQLAWDAGARVVVVDVLATSLEPLAPLLDASGPIKIVHDVAFDARLLADAGVPLGRVHDTAVAARMLGRTATGLGALLEGALGVVVDKAMQQHDWRIRPFDEKMLFYLASDVGHLEALAQALWQELGERAIEDAVLEETDYRIASATEAARVPRPPHALAYQHVKGAERLNEPDLTALRSIACLREAEAERRDVPPHRVAPADTLIALARARPLTPEAIRRVRGMSAAPPAFVADLARALSSAGGRLPDAERAWLERPSPPAALLRARREREARVLSWRRAEAKARGVDEQVVLPGHCLREAVEANAVSLEELSRVRGIGSFRVRRNGEAIVAAIIGPAGEQAGG